MTRMRMRRNDGFDPTKPCGVGHASGTRYEGCAQPLTDDDRLGRIVQSIRPERAEPHDVEEWTRYHERCLWRRT